MAEELPTILISYPGPCSDSKVQDIIIYLRPEANGILVESTILKTIGTYPSSGTSLKIVYMANIPGSFIAARGIIEEYYRLQIRFAREGKDAFTPTMRRLFKKRFGIQFEEADIIGAFAALERLGLSEEELFTLWVPPEDFTKIHRQSIKRIDGLFVVNYDIPALLHKNNRETNIFAMILRSFLPFEENHTLMDCIFQALREKQIISDRRPVSHILHYSKGPFEQILDGQGYIYTRLDRHVSWRDLSFFAFLSERGCKKEEILGALRRPIMKFLGSKGPIERHLFDFTYEDSFEEAYRKFQTRLPYG